MKLLHSDATPQSRDVLRIWIFGIWLMKIIFDPFLDIVALPHSLYHPMGFMMKFLSMEAHQLMLTAPFLIGLKIAIIFSLLMVIFKIKLNLSYLAACVSITLYQSLLRGFADHMNHAELGLLYAAYFLALFAWADAIMFKNPAERATVKCNLDSIPLVVILTFLCFSYSFIGIRRFIAGGIPLFQSDSILYWVMQRYVYFPDYPFDLNQIIFSSPFLRMMLKIGLPLITIFELLAPLCLISKRFRYAFLIVMISFHVMVLFLMRISFWENVLLYLLLFDFSGWFAAKKKEQPALKVS